MAETDENEIETPKKASKRPFVIGLVLALLGGGGAFYAVYSGLILGKAAESESHDGTHAAADIADMPDVAFVPLEPLVISLGSETGGRHLRFRAQLEVVPAHKGEVETLIPRVIDVLNSYLRALDLKDLEDNSALVRLRAQMLRRVQIVTGGERVNDLLIMEFVLN